MSAVKSWIAYRLDVPSLEGLFSLIKENIVSYVDQHELRFWITNYFTPGDSNPHQQFRVFVSPVEQQDVERHLDALIESGILLRRSEASSWNPTADATNRVKGNRERFQREPTVVVPGYAFWTQNTYASMINSDTQRIEELASLFNAVGEATKAFYKALPRKPVDPYVVSLALHILLNSLTYNGPTGPSEETNIRGFPPI